jgi:division protein CdvB (Snf7/Vps24/ESCRT-III family)
MPITTDFNEFTENYFKNSGHAPQKPKTNEKRIKKNKIKFRSHTTRLDYAKCRFCDWQFIGKTENEKFITKMYCLHLQKSHNLTKEQTRKVMKSVKNTISDEYDLGSQNNIDFMIDDGHRLK